MTPPELYYEDCMTLGTPYPEIYCNKLAAAGKLRQICALHPDAGPLYCESFALTLQGYEWPYECNKWPQYMVTYCDVKKNASTWDENCAQDETVGERYCRGFAEESTMRDSCISWRGYLEDWCDYQATENVTVDSC